jgi:hypothetical protein
LGKNSGHLHEDSEGPAVDSAAFYPNASLNLTKAFVVFFCPTIKYIKLDMTNSLKIKFISLLPISPKLNTIQYEIQKGSFKVKDKKHTP